MNRVFAVSILAVSLSILLVPSAHAFGVEPASGKVDASNPLDLSDSAPFLASVLNAQSSVSNPGIEQLSNAALAEQIAGPVALATTVVTEGFEDISTLSAKGWAFQNNSSPPPDSTTATANWEQGSSGLNGQTGTINPTAYIDVQSLTSSSDTTGTGQLSNWLITPVLDFARTSIFSFFTRTALGNPNGELLEVRLSTSGLSVDVGNTVSSVGVFTTLLQTIGSLNVVGAYPGSVNSNNAYQQFTYNLAPKSGSGRIAFRVNSPTVEPGGTSSFIAIDTVSYDVPEPAMASSLSGFAILSLVQFFKSKRKQA
jgi:hypothetical protein